MIFFPSSSTFTELFPSIRPLYSFDCPREFLRFVSVCGLMRDLASSSSPLFFVGLVPLIADFFFFVLKWSFALLGSAHPISFKLSSPLPHVVRCFEHHDRDSRSPISIPREFFLIFMRSIFVLIISRRSFSVLRCFW